MTRAESIDRQIDQIAAKGVKAVRSLGLQVRAATLRAYRNGGDVQTAIRDSLAPLSDVLQAGMTAGHGLGVVDAVKWADMRVSKVNLDRASVYNKDLDLIKSRLLLTDAQRQAIADLYGPEAATVTGEIGTELEAKVLRAISDAQTQNLHVREGTELIRKAFDAAGVTPTNSYTIENVFRTQVAMSHSAGRWNANSQPEIQEILWGYTYNTVGDDRVRPTHAAMDGTRAPKDDPLWDRFTPPCGYSCRCQLIEIFVDDPASQRRPTRVPKTVNVGGVDVPVEPDEGWDFNPGRVFEAQLGLALVEK